MKSLGINETTGYRTGSTTQKEIDLLKQLAERYRTQKRGLMQKLLTGGVETRRMSVQSKQNEVNK